MAPDGKRPMDGANSAKLKLLRLNYEYLLSSCAEHEKTDEIRNRMTQIETEIIALFWGLSRPLRPELSVQFRAFIQMRKNYKSA